MPLESLAIRLEWLSTPASRNLAGAIATGVLIASVEFAVTRGAVPTTVLAQAGWWLRLSAHWVLAALPLGLALLASEHVAAGGLPSRASYLVAVAAGSVAGACLLAVHGRFVDPSIARTAVGVDLPMIDRFMYGLSQLGFWGAIGAAVHRFDIRHRLGVDALRREEVARLEGERAVAESQLAALQAQVEPEFVLSTLDSIERLFTQDPVAADRALDSLIRFLRIAIPQLRGATSTIGQEIDLLDAYVDVVGAVPNGATQVTAQVGPSVRALRLPPGLVVSLVQRTAGPVGAGPTCVTLREHREGSGHVLLLEIAPARTAGDDAWREFVARAGERLGLARGPGNSITILSDGRDRTLLEIQLGLSEGESHVSSSLD